MKDYLVIYEDDGEGGDDSFVVDVARRRMQALGALEVEHDLQLGLANQSSKLGLAGLIITLVGAVVATIALFLFSLGYPDAWTTHDHGQIRGILVTGLAAFFMLLVGTSMTFYGRRIQAHGHLSGVRIIEKSPTGAARLR